MPASCRAGQDRRECIERLSCRIWANCAPKIPLSGGSKNMKSLKQSAAAIPRAAPSAAAEQRVKSLEAIVEQQSEQLEQLSKAKWSLPTAPKRVATGSFIRVVVPDTHGSVASRPALAAFLADLKELGTDSIREIILLGDHLECGGFLAQHHVAHYVAQSEYTFADDVDATNCFLDELQSVCPKASIDYLEGNHERRLESWCVTQTLRNQADAEYLRKLVSSQSVLHLEKRGINWIKQGEFYDGLSIPATIRRGKCFFTHGARAGKSATSATLGDFAGCVVHGHTHTAAGASGNTVHAGRIVAYCPGCLCELQPLWRHTSPTAWSHGYGLQFVNKGGEFTHLNVPIDGGKSFVGPLLKMVKV
jgi:hypothetical protein